MPNQSGDKSKFVNDNYRNGYDNIFGKKGVVISFPSNKEKKMIKEDLDITSLVKVIGDNGKTIELIGLDKEAYCDGFTKIKGVVFFNGKENKVIPLGPYTMVDGISISTSTISFENGYEIYLITTGHGVTGVLRKSDKR